MKFKCPCCGYYTLPEKMPGSFEQCPVCFWAYDLRQAKDPDLKCPPNGVSLNEARMLFSQNGICDDSIYEKDTYVRAPKEDEFAGKD